MLWCEGAMRPLPFERAWAIDRSQNEKGLQAKSLQTL
jgi:hypothetical protein